MKKSLHAFSSALLASLTLPALAAPNPYEWVAVSPIVVTALGLGDDGKKTEVRVERVLRGDVNPGQVLRVDVRRANRERNLEARVKPLRLDEGVAYILLLEPTTPREPEARNYDLVRGIAGVRELPAEGSDVVLSALQRFIEIQDRHDDSVAWRELGDMLGGQNPVMLEAALDLFLKFRRGDPELLPVLRRLLDQQSPLQRELAAKVIGQILGRSDPALVPDMAAVREELVARARRDDVVAVRVASTEALGSLSEVEAVRELLEDIADDDPDQSVRYAAERLLYELRLRRRAREGNSGTSISGAGSDSPNRHD